MAIVWGAWETAPSPGGTSGMRVGFDASWSTPSNSSTTVTLTVDVYTENYLTYTGDSQVINFGGGVSWADYSFSNSSGTNPVYRTTRTFTWTYAAGSYGSSPGVVTATATMSGVFDGTTADISKTYTIPARPYGVPTAPSAVTATRNSDTQDTVNWTRNATSGKPYTSQTVQMATYSKGTGWSDFVTVATVSSTATSYVKTGLSANHIYQFRVRANNTVGSSGYVGGTSTWTYMTPAAPSGVSSSINSAGTQITTDWDDNAYVSGVISFSIERSVNGGAYASVATGIAQGTTSWTDTTPGAGTNTYRVKAVSSTGSLSSAFATGNTVTTVVPPLAPTNLSPNGSSRDLENSAVVLTWKHNPGADGAKQSSFYIDYSTNGGGTWTALNGAGTTSTVSSYTIPAGTLTNGVNYLWRVRTRGSTLAAIGPNSASASLIGSATPTVTITAPTATTTSLPLVVTWDYNQDQSSPEAAWEAKLSDGTNSLQALSASDSAETVTFTYPVVDGGIYVVSVRAKSGAGLWSNWATVTTTIDLPIPAAITATPEYQPATGSTVIHLEALAPVGAEITATTAIVERRVPGSDQWVKLIDGVTLPTDVVDPLPATRGTTEYRATSVSTAPSYRVNGVVSVTPDDPYLPGANPEIQWVFLNYGDAFEKLLRFRSNPKTSESTGRAKATRSLLGRSKPVLLLGEATQREVAAEGNLHHDPTGLVTDYLFDSPPAEWSAAALEAEVVCYRDFTGRRIFGSLDDAGADDVQPGLGTVSLKVTEVDFTEQYGVEPD